MAQGNLTTLGLGFYILLFYSLMSFIFYYLPIVDFNNVLV